MFCSDMMDAFRFGIGSVYVITDNALFSVHTYHLVYNNSNDWRFQQSAINWTSCRRLRKIFTALVRENGQRCLEERIGMLESRLNEMKNTDVVVWLLLPCHLCSTDSLSSLLNRLSPAFLVVYTTQDSLVPTWHAIREDTLPVLPYSVHNLSYLWH